MKHGRRGVRTVFALYGAPFYLCLAGIVLVVLLFALCLPPH